MSYVVKEKRVDGLEFRTSIKEGFQIKGKLDKTGFKNIILYNNDFKDYYITQNYRSYYTKLLSVVMSILSDDDNTDTDFELALNETARIEAIILNKYKKHINLEKIKAMLKDLALLEQELKIKKDEMIISFRR